MRTGSRHSPYEKDSCKSPHQSSCKSLSAAVLLSSLPLLSLPACSNLVDRFIIGSLEQKQTHRAFLRFRLPDDRKIHKEWNLESIREVQRRRYLTRKTALEIFMKDGTSLVINFPDANHEEVSHRLIRVLKARSVNLVYFSTLEPRRIIEKSELTKYWQNYEISNFQYLMALNALAGRSYKDLTQYHVFPWILSQYSSDVINLEDSACYRNLMLTMGALGSEERTNTFKERFENVDPFNPTPKFHYGSHYSSPAVILQFLIRLSPYSEGAKELQGGRFDLADRLFFAIEESFNASIEEVSDVRELIPEFFCLPDFLVNREKLNFGKTQTGTRVNHVQMPKWSRYNPYRFVTILRLALESEIVSKNLHHWIDLIFGYKQRGKEAEKALNAYYYLTYEDMVDLDTITDPDTRIATEAQIIHFGQTPSQLFVRPHPQRLNKDSLLDYKIICDSNADIRNYRPKSRKEVPKISKISILSAYSKALVSLKFLSDVKLLGIQRDGTLQIYRWWNSTTNSTMATTIPFSCGVEKEKKISLERPRGRQTTETLLTSFHRR